MSTPLANKPRFSVGQAVVATGFVIRGQPVMMVIKDITEAVDPGDDHVYHARIENKDVQSQGAYVAAESGFCTPKEYAKRCLAQ